MRRSASFNKLFFHFFLLPIIFCYSFNAIALTPSEIAGYHQEIGAEGRCAEAGYVYSNPGQIIPYTNKVALLSSQLIGNASVSQIMLAQKSLYQPYVGIPLLPNRAYLPNYSQPSQSSNLYKVTYKSGQQTLSGLVVIPNGSAANGIVVYDHATQVSKISGAPSTPSNEACTVITALAGKGRILAMPDYIGYGVNNGDHPYALGIQNAPAGIDIIIATHELFSEINRNHRVASSAEIGTPLAVTGYSEGGGNSYWLARQIIQNKINLMGSQLTMIASMSGNYDMTGATAQSLIVRQPVDMVLHPDDLNQYITYLVKPVLVAFAAQGAAGNSTSTLSQMLMGPPKPFLQFVQANPLPVSANLPNYMSSLLSSSYDTGYTLTDPNPSSLMVPAFANAIKTTNLNFSAVNLWNNNNNVTWIPINSAQQNIPTYLTGLLQDQVVPFAGSNYPVPPGYTGGHAYFAQGNSQNVISSMRQQNIGAAKVSWCGIDAVPVPTNINGKTIPLTLNHLTGLPPVIALAAQAIETGSISNLPVIPDPSQ